jgi:hypothetical protein
VCLPAHCLVKRHEKNGKETGAEEGASVSRRRVRRDPSQREGEPEQACQETEAEAPPHGGEAAGGDQDQPARERRRFHPVVILRFRSAVGVWPG